MSETDSDTTMIATGRHLRLMKVGSWEYVQRTATSDAVGIIAGTDAGKLLLVEQYRPPVRARVIELPAGLVGDLHDQPDELVTTAAKRELLEETGYAARSVKVLARGPLSPGLSDERITLVRADGLNQTGPGGGDGSENIVVHEVPLSEIVAWLNERAAAGVVIDLKVYAGLFWLNVKP